MSSERLKDDESIAQENETNRAEHHEINKSKGMQIHMPDPINAHYPASVLIGECLNSLPYGSPDPRDLENMNHISLGRIIGERMASGLECHSSSNLQPKVASPILTTSLIRPGIVEKKCKSYRPMTPKEGWRVVNKSPVLNNSLLFPVQSRRNDIVPNIAQSIEAKYLDLYETVGDPSHHIYRSRLPPIFLQMLDQIINDCEVYSSTLPLGWRTDLYSLTKQDISLRSIPATFHMVRPLVYHLKRCLAILCNSIRSIEQIQLDRNQPHVLKYSCRQNSFFNTAGVTSLYASEIPNPMLRNSKNQGFHTGVELHLDKCDYTISLMLSRSHSYEGGGTYFPVANQIVRLNFGEFLIHPGGTVHSGVDITNGTRYLFLIFADVKRDD